MEILIQVAQFILSLSLLVFIHELGHFFFARLFGIRVDKFYIFFDAWGFSLLKFKIGETQFGVGWIPFGGYCKIAGMIDESMDTEFLKSEPQSWEFRSRPAWQRLLVMTGGVIMNVVLAAVIYIGMSHRWGEQYVAAEDVRYGYAFSELGREAGFENGDRVVSVGGERFENWAEIFPAMVLGNLPVVEVERAGERLEVQAPAGIMPRILNDSKAEFMRPRTPFVVAAVPEGHALRAGDSLVAVGGREMAFFDEYQGEFARHSGEQVDLAVVRGGVRDTVTVEVSPEGLIGVAPYDYPYFLPVQTRQFTWLESVPNGIKRAGDEIGDYWQNLKLIVKPETGAYKSVGGFVAIGNMFAPEWNWHRFWSITAVLSIMLAVMNILPIPALDGGHVLFLLYEVVTRRRPSDKFLERAQVVGLVILLALLLFANANDIFRLLTR